jgi:hypothetical protein
MFPAMNNLSVDVLSLKIDRQISLLLPHVLNLAYYYYYYFIIITMIIIFIVIIVALQPFIGPWPLFQFLDPIHS